MRAIGQLGILLLVTLTFVFLRFAAGPSSDLWTAEFVFILMVVAGYGCYFLFKLNAHHPRARSILTESYVATWLGCTLFVLSSSHHNRLIAAAVLAGLISGCVFWWVFQRPVMMWYAGLTTTLVAATAALAYLAWYTRDASLPARYHQDGPNTVMEICTIPAWNLLLRAQDLSMYRARQKARALAQTENPASTCV